MRSELAAQFAVSRLERGSHVVETESHTKIDILFNMSGLRYASFVITAVHARGTQLLR